MLLDLRQMPDGSVLEADLCIIGSGPAGIALAREMEATTLRVVLLESGGLEIDPEVQDLLNLGEIAGLPHDGMHQGRGRALGGSAKLWAGQCLPLDEIDFERRDWVPHSGWPFQLAELMPYYRRAETFFRLGAETYDEGIYRQFGLAAPAWNPAALRTHFTIYTPEPDTGRAHLRALQRSSAIQVVTNATVTAIETNDAISRTETVVARSLCGRHCVVKARAFVLCAGGLENARILLNSNRLDPAGLGNAHDLVGRFFQDHPNGYVATLKGGDTADLQDRFRLLYARKRRYFPKFALSPHVQRDARVLNANAHLVFDYDELKSLGVMRDMLASARRRSMPDRPLKQLIRLAGDAGNLLHVLRRRYLQGRSPNLRPTAVRLQVYLEQAPNRDSRVMLSREVDRLGSRQLRLDWRLGELEHATLRTMARTAQTEFGRLGLGELQPEDWVVEPSEEWRSKLSDCYHHAGTTRVADDQRDGVVDRNCRVFGIDGLYVCGGSVFPTSGYANPTMTIVAMAIRLADHLRSHLIERKATEQMTAKPVLTNQVAL